MVVFLASRVFVSNDCWQSTEGERGLLADDAREGLRAAEAEVSVW